MAFEEHSNSAQTMAKSPCLGKQAPQGSKARGLATGRMYLLNDLTTVRMRLCGTCKQADSGQKICMLWANLKIIGYVKKKSKLSFSNYELMSEEQKPPGQYKVHLWCVDRQLCDPVKERKLPTVQKP